MATWLEMEQAARESEMHTAHELGREQGIEEGREQGIEEGREQGIEEGMEKAKMDNLAAVVRDFGVGLSQAMRSLGVSPEKQAEVEKMLQERGIEFKE